VGLSDPESANAPGLFVRQAVQPAGNQVDEVIRDLDLGPNPFPIFIIFRSRRSQLDKATGEPEKEIVGYVPVLAVAIRFSVVGAREQRIDESQESWEDHPRPRFAPRR
jgi:hypothetical protein